LGGVAISFWSKKLYKINYRIIMSKGGMGIAPMYNIVLSVGSIGYYHFVGGLRFFEKYVYVGRRFVTKYPGGHPSGN